MATPTFPTSSTVLVTGAARRLGRAIALALSYAGHGVAIHYNGSEGEARALLRQIETRGGRAALFRADLADPAQARALVDRTAAWAADFDAVVNNASAYWHRDFADVTQHDLDMMWRVNAMAPYIIIQEFTKLRGKLGGAIVNLCDVAGSEPYLELSHYSPTKAALEMITRSLARELAPGFQVNGVGTGTALPPEDARPDQLHRWRRKIPEGRFTPPDAIADMVVYLLRARHVTGQIIHVDGGHSLA